jgi:DNA-binding transcriptional ArsR family regulator
MSRASAAAARAEEAAPLFAALGDETRLGLLQRLAEHGPESISQLSECSPMSRQGVTKHLEVLSRAGLVRGRRRGREHLWELEPGRLGDARAYLESVSRLWDEALGRLKDFVEE